MRPQNVYRNMWWVNQQDLEMTISSETALQLVICSPLIIFVLYEGDSFSVLLQDSHLSEFLHTLHTSC